MLRNWQKTKWEQFFDTPCMSRNFLAVLSFVDQRFFGPNFFVPNFFCTKNLLGTIFLQHFFVPEIFCTQNFGSKIFLVSEFFGPNFCFNKNNNNNNYNQNFNGFWYNWNLPSSLNFGLCTSVKGRNGSNSPREQGKDVFMWLL